MTKPNRKYVRRAAAGAMALTMALALGGGTLALADNGGANAGGGSDSTDFGTIGSVKVDVTKIKVTDVKYDAKTGKLTFTLKYGDKVLVSGKDFDFTFSKDATLNQGTLTLNFKGAYNGSHSLTIPLPHIDLPTTPSTPDKPTTPGTPDKPTTPGTPDKPSTPDANKPAEQVVKMLRLYNPYNGEHLYTANQVEHDALVEAGWRDEGTGWYAPKSSDAPVYRLYNKYNGDHHYTTDKGEYDALAKFGWTQEGIGWYSAPEKGGVALYRQFNPYEQVGTHNYTTSKNENDTLVKLGWRAEGIAWYGVKVDK